MKQKKIPTDNGKRRQISQARLWARAFHTYFLASSNLQLAVCNLQLATSNMQHAAGWQRGKKETPEARSSNGAWERDR